MSINILPIIKKEFKSYFNSPIAYIVLVAFLVFSSVWLFYLQQFFARNVASLRIYFGIIPVVFIFLMPAITMRSWAEEKKMGTIEVLLTLPFKEGELVIGKFLAALGMLIIMMVLTLPIPLFLSPFGTFDWGEIFSQYIGLLLIGAAGISLGLFISAQATNQLSAFIIGVIVLLFLTLVTQVNQVAQLPPWAAGFFNYLSLGYHFESFGRGLIDSHEPFYYLFVIPLFLSHNPKTLIFQNWQCG